MRKSVVWLSFENTCSVQIFVVNEDSAECSCGLAMQVDIELIMKNQGNGFFLDVEFIQMLVK